MSRVIKLQPGGQVNKPARLFEWAGKQYDQDALLNEYSRRRQDWVSKNGYNRKQQELFDQGFNQMVKALQSPGLKRNPDGSWSNTVGASSTGYLDRNILGGVKKNDNNAIGLATALLDDIMSSMPAYSAPSTNKEAPKKKERFNINLKEAVTKRFMPSGYDASIWERYDPLDKTSGKRGNAVRSQKLTEVIDNLIEQVNDPNFESTYELPTNISDRNQWLQRLQNAREKLADGTLTDEDYTSLAEAGLGGLDELLGNIARQENSSGTTSARQALDDYIESTTSTGPDGKQVTSYFRKGEDTPLQEGWVFNDAGPWDRRSKYFFKNGKLYTPESDDPDYLDMLNRRYQSTPLPKTNIGYGNLRRTGLKEGDPDWESVSDLSGLFEGMGPGSLLRLIRGNGESKYVYGKSDKDGNIDYYDVDPSKFRQNALDKIYKGSIDVGGTPTEIVLGSFAGNPKVGGLTIPHYDPDDYKTFDANNLQVLFPHLRGALKEGTEEQRQSVINFLNKALNIKNGPFKGTDDAKIWEWSDEKAGDRGSISYKDGKWYIGDREISSTPTSDYTVQPNRGYDGILMQLVPGYSSMTEMQKNMHRVKYAKYVKEFGNKTGGHKVPSVEDFNRYIPKGQLGIKIYRPTKRVETEEEKERREKVSKSYTQANQGTVGDALGEEGALNMTWQDKTRLATAFTDVIGVGLGLIPGANLASTATGIGASVGQAVADYSDDRVGGWEATGNLLANLGMDAISLIPVGKTLKAAKSLPKIAKALPLLIPAITASTAIANKDEIIDTLKKLGSGNLEDFNKKDFQNLAIVGSTFLGIKYATKYTKNKTLFGEQPSGRKAVQYVNKKTGETGSVELDEKSITSLGRKGNIDSAKKQILEKVNSAAPEGEKLTIDDIDVGTNVLKRLKTDYVPGDPTKGNRWRRLGQTYHEPNKLREYNNMFNFMSDKSLSSTWLGRALGVESIPVNVAADIPAPKVNVKRKSPISSETLWQESIHGEYKSGGKLRKLQGGGYINTGMNNNAIKLNIDRQNVINNMWKAFSRDNPTASWQDFITAVVNPYNESYNRMIGSKDPNDIRAHQEMTFNNPYLREVHNATVEALYNQYRQQGLSDAQIEAKLGAKNALNVDGLLGSRTAEYNLLGDYRNPTEITPISAAKPMIGLADRKFELAPMANQTIQATSADGARGANIKPRGNFQFLPEDAIAAGRMLGTVAVNNWANRRLQGALRPTLIDTYENYIPQTEDYIAKTSAYNQAAELQRQAGRVAAGTSDASLGAAALLEATRQGRQLALQGDIANSQRLYQTGEQGRAESNAAKARRIEVANRNRGAMNQVEFAKAQMDAQTKQGNWMQAIQPWAASIENRLRTNRGIQKQIDLESARLNSQIDYAKNMRKLQTDYNTRFKEWQNGDTSKTQQDWFAANPTEYESWNTDMFNLQSQSQLNAMKDKSLLGRGAFVLRPLGQYSQYKAKGGKFTGKDRALIARAKDFNKSIREQQKNFLKELQSIRRENSLMMRHISSFTAQLIKSGMSWK